MKLFVTGATGFLGYHFVLRALEEGHEIVCLRRATSKSLFEPKIENKIRWIEDDRALISNIRDFNPDVLVHSAWAGVRGEDRNSDKCQQQNIIMSEKYFKLFPYKQIIALGSQAEYGFYINQVSEDDKISPCTDYGYAKDVCRRILEEYASLNDIEWQWIRIFTVFGEKQTGGLIDYFAKACMEGKLEFNTTDGLQTYSYLYAADYAEAMCKLIGKKGFSGVYNLSQPKEHHTNREILERIKVMLKSDIKIRYGTIPYNQNQIMNMDGNVEKFESHFGPINHTDFNKALRATLSSIKNGTLNNA